MNINRGLSMKLAIAFGATALAVLAAATLTGPASAANCAAATGVTEHAICSNPAVAKADAAMNAAFDALIKQSTPTDQKVFRDSQSAWHDNRDTDCDYADGTEEKPAKIAIVTN